MTTTLLPFSIFYFLFSIFNSHAQSTILSFHTLPASPTTNDVVKVVASLSFTSGDCALTEQGHTTNLTHTDAYAHHCLGFLTFICNTTDTFELGTLPAGDHSFVLSLSSGGGPAPCSPGIVIDDTDSITFTVDPGVGINVPDAKAVEFSVYPNPASNSVTLSVVEGLTQNFQFQICNTQGQLITHPLLRGECASLSAGKGCVIDINTLPTGLYYLTLQSAEGTATKKFEVIH